MPTQINRDQVRDRLEEFDLQPLFIEDLGWDHGGENLKVNVEEHSYHLEAIAHKRGMVVYQQVAQSDGDFPDYPTRQKIEKQVTKAVREHIIVYAPHDESTQHWQWVKREPGQPDRSRSHLYNREQSGESLIQKLEHLTVSIEEEEDLSIVDVSGRVRAAFNVDPVTRRFYERFKTEHHAFLSSIDGIQDMGDREWYTSIMLNRMMFIYFIQKRRFLDGDVDYLRNRLRTVQEAEGYGRFHGFYRLFLMRLFHEGLGQPEADRSSELTALIGNVPYLNGGLFDVHDLERDNPQIEIPDEAFKRIFDFFDAYQWHLDDRPLYNDNEINPDVLGYIFEKYINQKQMGAYYTKEDITGYIGRNTIIPFLFEEAKKHCPIAFKPGGGVWRLLQDDPERYFYKAVRHGITYDVHKGVALDVKLKLPTEIATGQKDVSKRETWNEAAPSEYALPTETWREHVARRERYEEVYAKLTSSEVTSINDLITYNLDIEQFAQDAISSSEGPELVRAFWKAVTSVSVLDPTCGSGAFLFAALNILEPIYSACLDAMQQFLDDQKVSKRKHHPESLNDFRKILDQVDSHENETYFILKSIIVENLYGVDIMEEAVEICKLRLFLKLVAQLETYEQIEPLPDIDFNVRAGNTLVGFASLDEVRKALGGNLFKLSELPKIEARAEDTDRAFRQFQSMQTEQNMDASDLAAAKSVLRGRLNEIRVDLDRYLADEYGVKQTDDKQAYDLWRDSHQPFHWLVEFYGIMKGGGFDVVIGNPPYVTYPNKNVNYALNGQIYQTLSSKNLYCLVFERSIALAGPKSPVGLIVQLTALSSEKLAPLQKPLLNRGLFHALSFPRRPKSVFAGVEMPVSILLSTPASKPNLLTTKIRRFYAEEERFSIENSSFCEHSIVNDGHRVAKFGSKIEASIYNKIESHRVYIGNLASQSTKKGILYYQEACRYWAKVSNRKPFFKKNGEESTPSHWRSISLYSERAAAFVTCVLNSSLFYWYYSAFSDCEHVNDALVRGFPITDDWNGTENKWELLSANLMNALEATSKRKTISTKQGHVIEYNEISGALSKAEIDSIERNLADMYALTLEELDFIINYDIKYRMGR